MKIISVFGTRPEIIKFSPVLELLDLAFEHKIVHTGQHYSFEMDKVFFDQLKIRKPDYRLEIGSGTHGYQLGNMLIKLEEIFEAEKPDFVIVQGDTNSTIGGALAAAKKNIKVIHLEAGCRSFNRQMPEEINRIVTDHCSDMLIAPDKNSYENLKNEGIGKDKIFLLGSTLVDACYRNIKLTKNIKILQQLKLEPEKYAIVTIHRAENTNNAERLKGMIEAINDISEKIKVVFPIHPRTRKIIEDNKITLSKKIKLAEPQGYLEFLTLIKNARFAMTDSGGAQEECAYLNTPCLILREETEWVEFVKIGKNILAGTKKQNILKYAGSLIDSDDKIKKMKNVSLESKEGVSKRIVDAIKHFS